MPPLRQRREDIGLLAEVFARTAGERFGIEGVTLRPELQSALAKRDYPGNVRELENIVERAMIAATGAVLELDSSWLSPRIANSQIRPGGLHDVERQAIEAALQRSHGKIYGPGGAAEALRLKPTTLYGKMRKLGIDKKASPAS